MAMTFRTRHPLRIKTPSGRIEVFAPGDTFSTEWLLGPMLKLLETGQIIPAEPCRVCQEYDYWLSVHGALVCHQCHPAMPKAVKVRIIERGGRVLVMIPGGEPIEQEPEQIQTKEQIA